MEKISTKNKGNLSPALKSGLTIKTKNGDKSSGKNLIWLSHKF